MTINKKYHNENTALERSEMNYLGPKLAIRDPNPRPKLP